MKITLTAPARGSSVSLLSDTQREFLANTCRTKGENVDELDYLNLKRQGIDCSLPKPVHFAWACEDSDGFVLELSEKPDFSSARRFKVDARELEIGNLLIGQEYFWRVFARDGACSEISSFTTDPTAPRWIEAGGLSNIRDIGGVVTRDGRRVRQGMVFRGGELEFHQTVTPEGIRVLRDELGIRTDFDLRGEAVGKIDHSALGEDIAHRLIPCKAYADFLLDKEVAKQLLEVFAERESYPFYVHCWGGADRTGTLILLLCAILGVGEHDLFSDYEITSLSIWGERSIYSELFTGFLTELSRYGGESADINERCVAYCHACGVTDELLDELRAILLE